MPGVVIEEIDPQDPAGGSQHVTVEQEQGGSAYPPGGTATPGASSAAGPRLFGVYPALVAEADGLQAGFVTIRLPWAEDEGSGDYLARARLASPYAGSQRGIWFIPEVGDEVLVMFEGGDPSYPYVIGALWNQVDGPPVNASADRKLIRTRSGLEIRMNDRQGEECIQLSTPGGQTLRLCDQGSSILIQDANGSRVSFEAGGIRIDASGTVNITASQLKIDAAMLDVNAPMARFSGVVQAETVITNTVVASSYTPGAGNLW